MTQITREIAQKVRDAVDAGLVSGIGEPTPGLMCVEAAVCYALGLPHGDDPGCVSPALRRLKIRLNNDLHRHRLLIEGNPDVALTFYRRDKAGHWCVDREEIAVRVVRRD